MLVRFFISFYFFMRSPIVLCVRERARVYVFSFSFFYFGEGIVRGSRRLRVKPVLREL